MSKEERKAALKAEAAELGISYEELKKVKKEKKEKKKRKMSESDKLLNDSESQRDANEKKRMRSYSRDDTVAKDDDKNQEQKRRRTRSMDAAEAEKEDSRVEGSKKTLSPEEWRKEHQLSVFMPGNRDYKACNPYFSFKDAPFGNDIQRAIAAQKYENPTVIQAQAWPIAIAGNDMISIAKTGSGKTCGFLLPCLHLFLSKIKAKFDARDGPMMLVLAPTRELAQQISEETQKFGRATRVRSVCCYGGAPKFPQIAQLKRGVEIVIATPGRLNDLLDARAATLKNCRFVVLDEADRCLDMGFEPQIRSILKHVEGQEHQTLLFSATWPKEVEQLANEYLTNPVRINVGAANVLNANKDITQTVEFVQDSEKVDKLKAILDELVKQNDETDGKNIANEKTHAKAIIFVAKKASCDILANQLWDEGYAVDSLHGDRAQWERTKVTNAFKSGALRLLIATDVAARGLDVKDVGVVVNFDMPAGVNGVEDYVHRIGRTGRAGKKGKAYTFFTRGDSKNATKLVEVLKRADQEVPAWLQAMVRPRFGGGGGRGRGRSSGRGYGRGGGGGRSYMGGGGGGRGRGRGSYYGRR